MKNMHRLIACTIMFSFILLLCGCGKLNDLEQSNKFYEEVEKVEGVKVEFHDQILSKITDEQQKIAFEADYYQVTIADAAASIYFGLIQLYNIAPTTSDLNINKEGDTYTITDEDSIIKMKYDDSTKSVRLETYSKSNVLEFFTENTKLANGDYAYQLYSSNLDDKATVIQLVFNETSGRLSYNEVTSIPESIYKKTTVDTNYAKMGIRQYKFENNIFTFTGDLIDDPNPNKVVSNFTLSGLKEKYNLNEDFSIDDLILNVTYTDNTNTSIPVISSMVVGTLPSTESLGQKTLILKYQEIQNSFNFEVVEATVSNEEILAESFDNFYNTLFLDLSNSFIGTNIIRQDLLTNVEARDFFFNFNSLASGQWSHIMLLYESVMAIKADSEGYLGSTIFPDPTSNNMGKTAYCTYDEITKTYKVGYWSPKQLNTLYWFESEVTFDSNSDSLKAIIKAGVDASQILRCNIEYIKISDGNYALQMYYPQDENDIDGKYSVTEARFTNTEGSVVLNKWVNSIPTSIYQSSNLLNYAKSGDQVLILTPTTVTFTDSLRSFGEEFLDGFIYVKDQTGNNIYDGSLENLYLTHMKEKLYEFDDYNFNLYNSQLGLLITYLADYEKKNFNFSDYVSTNITKDSDTTTMVLTDAYETKTYVFKYSLNKLSVEYKTESEYELYELVKENNIYNVQVIIETVNEENKVFYNLYQAKYVDNKNMTFTINENVINKPISIYSSIPSNFISDGNKLYKLVNDVPTNLAKYVIHFSPENGEDDFILMTDINGDLILPNESNSGYTFKGWSNGEIIVGLGNVKVKFTEETYLSAVYE